MGSTKFDNLSKMQIDALKEVGNIGAAHAATALSQILDKTIMVSVSRFDILPLAEAYKTIGAADDQIVAVHLKLLGSVLGGIVLIFTLENAIKLSNIMGHTRDERMKDDGRRTMDEMDRSSVKEAGSILSAAYLSAIGRFVELSLIPSIPKIDSGKISETLSGIFSEITKRAEVAFCIETSFIESSINLKGSFLLVPEVESLDPILKNLGVKT